MISDRDIDTLIVHCSDTYANMDVGAQWIRDIHVRENGWADIGYHFVIRRDGTLEGGRDLDGDGNILEEVGAHAYGFNRSSVGVCLIGGKPDFNFTRAQMDTLEALVKIMVAAIPDLKVIGHRDVSSKACPGFDVKAYFGYLTNISV